MPSDSFGAAAVVAAVTAVTGGRGWQFFAAAVMGARAHFPAAQALGAFLDRGVA